MSLRRRLISPKQYRTHNHSRLGHPLSTAIQTKYDGIEYRSRLEARWASFMKSLRWDFTYEPIDGDGYIPDFLVHGDRPLFIEVKPAMTYKDYFEPCEKIDKGLIQFQQDVLIVGVRPFIGPSGPWNYEGAGLLGQYQPPGYDNESGCFDWSFGAWHACLTCKKMSIHHYNLYVSAVCGHGENGKNFHTPPIARMKQLWADACNDVKWRGNSR